MYVYLVEAPDATWCCPTCGKPATLYDHREERIWRHLDSCQFHTYLVAAAPRVNCATHGVLTADVPWSVRKKDVPVRSVRKVPQNIFRTGKSPRKRADGARRIAADPHTVSPTLILRWEYPLTGKNIPLILRAVRSTVLVRQAKRWCRCPRRSGSMSPRA